MQSKRAVSEEGTQAWESRGEFVDVGGLEGIRGYFTVFAGEIADLAGLGEGRIAGGGFPTDERIEVAEGAGAVSVGWDGCRVEVVDWTLC